MARRVSWTNNSSGHDGTTIHRSTATMDPQALPAPIGTVAAGTTEYVDSEALADGTYYYRVQDYQGASVSAASDEQSLVVSTTPDYASAQVGDEIGGGIYAGTITYADARQFHLVFANQAAAVYGLKWGTYATETGANDPDDGMANQNLVLTNFDDGTIEAFYHCRDYVDGAGNSDYYLPARNEIALADGLVALSHPEFSTDLAKYRWSSTEHTFTVAWGRRFSDGDEAFENQNTTDRWTRPIRRVPV